MMPDSTRLIELLGRWQRAQIDGKELSAEELCPDDPELAAHLAMQIELLQTAKPSYETGGTFKTMPSAGAIPTVVGELPQDARLLSQTEFHSPRVHGKGGIGIVYVATDRQLHREVAVKLTRAEPSECEDRQLELIREAEVTGKLEHPGVVPVYGLGRCDDGRPFYVMRFIQGESLESAIGQYHSQTEGPGARGARKRNLDFRGLLSRFVSVCYTVAYAHNRGIIHRDIKPENIMLGKYGETLLVDWGLAMPVDRDHQAKASGERTLMVASVSQSGNSSGYPTGTPAYMSPEQAEATEALTPATDVYSLGATLYKLVTNQLPCQGRDIFEMLKKVKAGDVPAVSARNPKAPKEFDAICKKAMAVDPRDRYASPLDLGADVERWLADEPVSVCPETRGQRLGRWMRRHRGVVSATGLGLTAALLAAMIAMAALKWSADRESAGREESLRLAAKFAARLMAAEIDLRWRILEKEAADPKLVALVEAANAMPGDATRKPVQDWLNETFQEYQKSDSTSSWFVDNRAGVIIAIAGPGITQEMRARTIGRSFAHRDYFHGQGKDLDPTQAVGVEPINRPNLSAIFKSTTDKNYKVAFSVPIRKMTDGRAETIGVLAMTNKIGMFDALRTLAKNDQLTVLIDTRTDHIDKDKKPRQGLVLHHRMLAQRQLDGEGDGNFHVPPMFLDRLLKLRSGRLAAEFDGENGRFRETGDFDNLDRSYLDPVSSSSRWTAAFEPVIIPGRSGKMHDTGWIVGVQGK